MNKYDPLEDNISSVELIDYFGTDLTVVNAARVSMAKESDWVYVDSPSDELGLSEVKYQLKSSDSKLISYLAKHNHWTPFSHPTISLRIKMPIFIARQWFKHMVGFTRNEVSRRYVSDTPEVYVPVAWRAKADNVKQGSSENLARINDILLEDVYKHLEEATFLYNEMISEGVCPEQVRMLLPQSMYTEFVETGSLAAYARLCKLRLDPHAQLEVRQYAHAVHSIIEPLFPVSWEALMN